MIKLKDFAYLMENYVNVFFMINGSQYDYLDLEEDYLKMLDEYFVFDFEVEIEEEYNFYYLIIYLVESE